MDDPNYIMVDLEFDSSSEAEALLDALWRNVWGSQQAQRQPCLAARRRES